MLAIVVVAVLCVSVCVCLCVCVPKLLGKVDLILYACMCFAFNCLYVGN